MLSTATGIATFGGGCFWCMEAVFNQLKGVIRAESGYCGGELANPTYEQICEGNTGHAEVVQIHYDTEQWQFSELVDIFFMLHDPTQMNRQGNDVGTQYRSVIFYHDQDQYKLAEANIQQLRDRGIFDIPIVTRLEPYHHYFPAEDYHQGYFLKNPEQSYCAYVVNPKFEQARQKLAKFWK